MKKLSLSPLCLLCVLMSWMSMDCYGASAAKETPGVYPEKHYSEWLTRSEMKRVPKSFLLDFSTKPKWSYVMGIELESMLDTYLRYGGDDILGYCQMYVDSVIDDKGNITGYRLEDYNLDQIRTGHFIARLHELYPNKKTEDVINMLITQMNDQPRTEEGVFWHKAIYAWQVWLDGIFMGLPFSVQTAKDFKTPEEAMKVYNDAVDQVSKTYERTLDPKTGLNRHAWDETREMFWADKETGLSQHCWGRAQGWYTMALIEILDYLPEDHPRRNEVIELLRKDLDSVIKWQDPKTGVWYQVMDSPEREGNYLESTCSSMFAYALLKAYRKGYLGAKYRDAGIKAYQGIIDNFIKIHPDNTISLTDCCAVAGLGPGVSEKVRKAAPKVKENKRRDGGYEYYLSEPVRDNDAKGVGPFIWASLEMERLGYDTSNSGTPIDRRKVVSRNNPVINTIDSLSSLTVGNGLFAITVDVTGFQSFPGYYHNGVPLTTMSEWGWHSFPNTENLQHSETMREMDLGHGHQETYAVEYKKGGRNQSATQYFRVNPHRLNLGLTGIEIKDNKGKIVGPEGIESINQVLNLWEGNIKSEFTAGGNTYKIETACLPNKDCVIYRVNSEGLKKGKAAITLRFPYPTGVHCDDAADWESDKKHSSKLKKNGANAALIERTIDDTKYYVSLRWAGKASLIQKGNNTFYIEPTDESLELAVEYSPVSDNLLFGQLDFEAVNDGVKEYWDSFWNNGAIVDFSECTDPRAKELERRVVLSQYLTALNAAGNMPPQETGLTYNSWFGRPHLEMTWWHAVDHSLWNRPEIMERMLGWYTNVAAEPAKGIAGRQGFQGARWMKMTDPEAGEAPSNTGSFLIWQQPHYIYMAEEAYRANPSDKTLKKYYPMVEETAAFMADYAKSCEKGDGDIRLFGHTGMQESMSKDFSYCHPFEQAYWKYGLAKAQEWRERNGLERNAEWDNIIGRLAPLHKNGDGLYSSGMPMKEFDANATNSAFDPYVAASIQSSSNISEDDFKLKSRSDHPAVLGACGLLPDMGLYEKATMEKTLDYVLNNWNWATTWGWDYGMVAMCAARLGKTDKALEAILQDTQKNTYLPNGHNYQDGRLRIYLPGNGSLLDAVAMMCAGWDGCQEVWNPGFPADGTWNVRWEGLRRMQ